MKTTNLLNSQFGLLVQGKHQPPTVALLTPPISNMTIKQHLTNVLLTGSYPIYFTGK